MTERTKTGIPTKATNPELITEVKASNGETLGVALDIGTYESFDEDTVLSMIEGKYGQNITKAGCTCVVKDRKAEGKGLLVGRNMDLSLSERALYKFQLDYGTYKAMGIAYSHASGPSAEEARQGMTSAPSEMFLSLIPAIATDYLNEKGLYIETNMRNLDYGESPETDFHDTKYGCTGTNPGKGLPNVFMASVPFYVSTRCATVDEVLNLLRNDINIYNLTTTREQFQTKGSFGIDWNFSFVVADALGNYGLIEIVSNQVVFNPQYGQANFYRNDESAFKETYPTGGWGKVAATGHVPCDQENVDGPLLDGKKCRYAVATEDLPEIQSVADMQQNMRKVLYSQTYSDQKNGMNSAISEYLVSQFNPRYEMIQCFPLVSTGTGSDDWALDFENGSIFKCTFEVLKNMSTEKFQELFREYCQFHYAGRTKAQLMEEHQDYWVTTHSIVTDIENKSWTVTFFEGDNSFNFSIQ